MSIPNPLFLIILFTFFIFSQSAYSQNQSTSSSTSKFPWSPPDNRFLISNNSIFAAGFLLAGNTTNRYIFSVYYHNITPTTTIWSVNDNSPVNASSSLFITTSGELRLGDIPFSGNSSSPILSLKDDGSLSFGSWSSFQYPTNTIVPNQNITGKTLSVRNGAFQFDGTSLIYNGSYDAPTSYYQSPNAFMSFDDSGTVKLQNGASFITSDFGDKTLRRLKLDDNGNLRIYGFDSGSGQWNVVWQAVPELCTIKGSCKPNYICMYGETYDTTVCDCPPGFHRVSGLDGEE
ncbi:putative receptor protein kinase ZmPK1 [Rutidosis leptorrhynchoides]|uniref:putative receptor protein kinase ZmPK1 n=1 Tax=Rutidosis leptorrhynchoides TaxID=125765 RepID=UPI003A9A19A6